MRLASVIIPCYNQARFVGASVASALAQSYPHVEVIVVDDGSTDDPGAMLSAYRGRIHYITQENRGLAAARNRGLQAARGDYLLFLDSDDLLCREALAELIALLEARPAYGLAYSAWQQIDEGGKQMLGEVRPGRHEEPLRDLLLRRCFFFASMVLFRRASLERVGGFDAALRWGEDADMWLRLARAGCRFGYIDRPLVSYRVHPSSMTANVDTQQVAGWQSGLAKFFSDPTLPPEIKLLEDQAHSVLHFETAGRYYRIGALAAAQAQLCVALELQPAVSVDWLLDWIAGTALDPRTGEPDQFINRVFDHLPPEATRLHGLRRRAHGRYATAALFAAHQRRARRAVQAQLLPALSATPTLLWNRGFLRIVAYAMLGGR